MKIVEIKVHNVRAITSMQLTVNDYLLLVGANNAGKSTTAIALLLFYGTIKWNKNIHFPKPCLLPEDHQAWVQLTYSLTDQEWDLLEDKYKEEQTDHQLVVKRYFELEKDANKTTKKIYVVINGVEKVMDDAFTPRDGISTKLGSLIYIPAMAEAGNQLKMTGPSPLRELMKAILEEKFESTPQYRAIADAFDELNQGDESGDGLFSDFNKELNGQLKEWNVKAGVKLEPPSLTDVLKTSLKPTFADLSLGDTEIELENFGMGYQRSVVNALIRMLATKTKKSQDEEETLGNLTLILYEEPEAFMHPSQQKLLAYSLHQLAGRDNINVIVTSHSTIFATHALNKKFQFCHLCREYGQVQRYQPDIDQVISDISDMPHPKFDDIDKDLLKSAEDLFFETWIENERSCAFFADKVLLVEGPTEGLAFQYLLENDWSELPFEIGNFHIVVAGGKYNFHLYMALFAACGIRFGILQDSDLKTKAAKNDPGISVKWNDFIDATMNDFQPGTHSVYLTPDFEQFLGTKAPDGRERIFKPVSMLSKLHNHELDEALPKLKEKFIEAIKMADRLPAERVEGQS